MACRSEFVTTDAAGGVSVLPLDGASIGGVGVDVAAEFASQVGNRGEDAARDDLAFDLGEPDLDLVEPGRIGGGEVKPDSGMLLQEVPDGLSLGIPRFDEPLRFRYHSFAGWSSLVARRAHNPKVVGSNPTPATNFSCSISYLEATAPVASFSFSVQSVQFGTVKPVSICSATSARHAESSLLLSYTSVMSCLRL